MALRRRASARAWVASLEERAKAAAYAARSLGLRRALRAVEPASEEGDGVACAEEGEGVVSVDDGVEERDDRLSLVAGVEGMEDEEESIVVACCLQYIPFLEREWPIGKMASLSDSIYSPLKISDI